ARPRSGAAGSSTRALLREREKPWSRPHEAARRDEAADRRPLDRPGEPLRDLVLVREHRGAHSDEHEFRERLIDVRLPWLRPDLVPARELGRVRMSALRVVDLD